MIFDVEIVLLFPVLIRFLRAFTVELVAGAFLFLVILIVCLFHE